LADPLLGIFENLTYIYPNCLTMKFLSLAPFVHSGPKYEESLQLFQELGFNLIWHADGYTDFNTDGCHFILQKFDWKEFTESLMVTARVSSAEEFRQMVLDKSLPERFGIRIGYVTQEPYGKDVNIIDIAGVCWHFVE
jgi:hypothetical protein